MKVKHNLLNMVFGKIKVISFDHKDDRRRNIWTCECECGNIKNIRQDALIGGRTNSCGCTQYDTISSKLRTNARIVTATKIYTRYNDGDITFDQFMVLSQLNCFYCGIAPNNKANHYAKKSVTDIRQDWIDQAWFVYNGLDRVNSTKPHLIDNVVPCCIQCNTAKLDYTTTQFKEWIKRVYKNINQF